ncbi:MAG TPA: hypothetical protein PLF92_10460 [Arenimonas sp.]|nr:hypothetical protein [Arenimonas sp.]
MKLSRLILPLALLIMLNACTWKTDNETGAKLQPTAAETRAADEASLLKSSRAAGVSDAEALAAKAEIDKVYDETSAKMEEAEAERNARMKQLRDEACVADCPDH